MLRVNGILIEQGHFPDGSLHIELPSLPLTIDPFPIRVEWKYENDAELFTLICIRQHYDQCPTTLVMPYIPHARMDRTKNRKDVFTLKHFCGVINSLQFDHVIVTDPHSHVSEALLDRALIDDAASHIKKAITVFSAEHPDNTALFFPDEGAMKRYSDKSFGYKFGFGMKRRDWETGKILGLDILQKENIIGKDVLIIDDICSRGGTFYHAAKALKAVGAKSVSLYVTHCENTILEGEIFKSGLIDQVYTTDSLVHCEELKEKVRYV